MKNLDNISKNKDFEELYCYIDGFVSANIESIYRNTGSLDFKKYLIKNTRINWITKRIEVKGKDLTDNQLKTMIWILKNDDYILWRIEDLVERFKNRNYRR